MSYDDLSFDEDEAIVFLRNLMPQGFAGADIMSELAPDGWAHCEFVRAFHPTAEQLYAEDRAHYEQLIRAKNHRPEGDGDFDEEAWPEEPPPNLDKIRAEYPGMVDVDPEGECRDIVGRLLWEVLADDHSMIANDGRRLDLGDYDDASSVLDLFDQGEIEEEPGMEDWLDMWDRGDSSRFSCDLAFIEGRADYRPVYELIFRRMQALEMDWIYQFPKLRLFGPEVPEAPPEGGDDFSPVEAFLSRLEQKDAIEEYEHKQAQLDARNEELAQEAAKQEPPAIVQAYMNVFGRRPSGWPPA